MENIVHLVQFSPFFQIAVKNFRFTDIQYEEMKAKLAEVTQDAPSAEIVEPEVLQRHFAKFDEAFFTLCSKGMFKISV